MPPTAADLVGNWRLVAYLFHPDDGDEYAPFGDNATGLITYTADGFMQVSVAASDRTTYDANDFQGGTVEQQAAAARSYLTYAGRYEVRDDRVLHIQEISLLPYRDNVTLERYAELDGDRLTLTTPPMSLGGNMGIGRIIWQRAGAE
jgi:hypothetical protein